MNYKTVLAWGLALEIHRGLKTKSIPSFIWLDEDGISNQYGCILGLGSRLLVKTPMFQTSYVQAPVYGAGCWWHSHPGCYLWDDKRRIDSVFYEWSHPRVVEHAVEWLAKLWEIVNVQSESQN